MCKSQKQSSNDLQARETLHLPSRQGSANGRHVFQSWLAKLRNTLVPVSSTRKQ